MDEVDRHAIAMASFTRGSKRILYFYNFSIFCALMYDVLAYCIQLQKEPNSIAIFLLGKNDNTKIRPSLFFLTQLSVQVPITMATHEEERRCYWISFGALFFKDQNLW